jgi:putative membrane protein
MGPCRLFPLLLLVIIGLMIYTLFRRSNSKESLNNIESVLNILKQRYAKGEISKDEFERMKREINLCGEGTHTL